MMADKHNEECWVIVGKWSERRWRGRRTRYSVGEPSAVSFNPKWVEDRENQKKDVIGFSHTHPHTPGVPSPTDYATMKAWVMSFGRPMLCIIKGIDGLRAWWFMDHELDSDPVECDVKKFGPFYRGSMPELEHWVLERKPTTMRYFTPLLHSYMNTHLVCDQNPSYRAWIDNTGHLVWDEDKARAIDPELWEHFDSYNGKEFEKLWDEGIEDYKTLLEKSPQVVKDFYEDIGSLHDALVKVKPGKKSSSIHLECEDGRVVELQIKHDKVWSGMTSPSWFGHPRWAQHLYEEFHFDDDKLSYHFTSSDGHEWAFYNITEMTWEITDPS